MKRFAALACVGLSFVAFVPAAQAASCSGYYAACMKYAGPVGRVGPAGSSRFNGGNRHDVCDPARDTCMKTGTFQTQFTSKSGLDRK